ncbi:MAG: IgGFc-binding protein [Labilithrix sp.]|nr:IgGFc-binding protein [Labilithrix sp.]
MFASVRHVGFVRHLLCGAAVASTIFACSTRPGFDEQGPLIAPAEEGGAPEPEAPPKTCGVHCSRDLKQVLIGCEGDEKVVATCSADEGCGEGKCVDACTAAVLSKGSIGCDFWAVAPAQYAQIRGGCMAVMVANTWDRGVSLTAGYGDGDLDISKSTYTVSRQDGDPVYTLLEGPLAPGDVAVVFLSHDPLSTSVGRPTWCPENTTPALLEDTTRRGTGRLPAFHIKSDAPISAYSMYPYGGARTAMPTATLLLPTASWTTSYVAVSPYNFGNAAAERSLQIIANEDDTVVTIRPTIPLKATPNVAGAPAGTPVTWTLGKGETVQIVQPALTGSPIESNKPVAVFGGSECTRLPTDFCDLLQQQIPPFSHWGSEYAAVPYKPRPMSFSAEVREEVPYTIVGAVDDTQLTYDPVRPRGAPETLRAGESANFYTDEIFVVTSQDDAHPFHVSVYMTAATFKGETAPGRQAHMLGDPDFVNVPPTGQYLDRYVFFTDFTFPETTLTVVRRKTERGFAPVELACAGEITGWKPLGTRGEYEFAWVTLTRSFHGEKFAKGTCDYGRQEAHSDGPFGITVWGIAPYASYGYVGGTGLRPIHDVPPPTVK